MESHSSHPSSDEQRLQVAYPRKRRTLRHRPLLAVPLVRLPGVSFGSVLCEPRWERRALAGPSILLPRESVSAKNVFVFSSCCPYGSPFERNFRFHEEKSDNGLHW